VNTAGDQEVFEGHIGFRSEGRWVEARGRDRCTSRRVASGGNEADAGERSGTEEEERAAQSTAVDGDCFAGRDLLGLGVVRGAFDTHAPAIPIGSAGGDLVAGLAGNAQQSRGFDL